MNAFPPPNPNDRTCRPPSWRARALLIVAICTMIGLKIGGYL